MSLPDLLTQLKQKLAELAYLRSTIAILDWDEQIYMPKKGAISRAGTVSYLSGLVHQKVLDLDTDQLLTRLHDALQAEKLDDLDAAIVREVWHDYSRAKKLPLDFVTEFARLSSEAHMAWEEARANEDFKNFQPCLEKILVMSQQEANYLGYTHSPYDALFDSYEPGMTTQELDPLFNELRQFLVPFIQQLQHKGQPIDPKILEGHYPLDEQLQFNLKVAQAMGFDLEGGRIDTSTHPFSIHINPDDVRITTRYNESNLFESLSATIHEAGHALYEQGLQSDQFGTPLAEAGSYGLHESQSRLWENMVGLSRPFWDYYYPELQKHFPKPFNDIDLADFYRAINAVQPSLIRVEADEVTYNLHIILRYEIEKDLLEGQVKVADLPALWNEKVKEYFGLTVPNDTLGVLQDIHWTSGFGYFPSYALGNLYAAQIYAAAEQAIPDLASHISTGQLLVLREWLRQQIHQHGRRHRTSDLLKAVTGEDPSSRHFVDYISKKYKALYGLA